MFARVLNALRRRLCPPPPAPAEVKTLDDEFLAWLRFANAGMLEPGNAYCMDIAIRDLPSDAPILEIGCFCGLSTNVMCYLLRKHGKNNRVLTSDKWIFEGADKGEFLPGSEVRHSDYRTYVMESFQRNVRFFGGDPLPSPIEVFSDEFFELWEAKATVTDLFGNETTLGGPLSFVFIDGNHTYEFAKRDFDNTAKFLEPGGYVLFDDSAEGSIFGCARLMPEIAASDDFELIMTNPNFLFRKRLHGATDNADA